MRHLIRLALSGGLIMVACGSLSAQSTGPAKLTAAGDSRTIGGITHEYAIGQLLAGDTYNTDRLVVTPGVLQPRPAGRIPEKVIGDFELQVFPNPVQSTVFLQPAFRRGGTLQYSVFDAAGRLIFGREVLLVSGIERQDLPVAHLASGQYFLRVIWSAGLADPRTTTYSIQKMW